VGALFRPRVARYFIGASEHCGPEGFGPTYFRIGAPPRLLGRQFIRNSVERLEHFVFQAESDQRLLGRGLWHRCSIYSVLTPHNKAAGYPEPKARWLISISNRLRSARPNCNLVGLDFRKPRASLRTVSLSYAQSFFVDGPEKSP